MTSFNDRVAEISRTAREVAVVVVSILLAFSLDSWWEGVKLDQDVVAVLESVREEMAANEISLRTSVSRHEEILDALNEALPAQSTWGVHDIAVIRVEVWEPRTGALETFIASGLLPRVDDPELRILLSSFGGTAQDYRGGEERALKYRDLARQRVASVGLPIWSIDDEVKSPVHTDVEMLNLLALRWVEEAGVIGAAEALRQHLARTLARLEVTLGPRR